MARRRPFLAPEELMETADRVWQELSPQDWLEAFRTHPKIGEKSAAKSGSRESPRWSAREQAGAAGAPAEMLEELARANRDYEWKFGYIFIVCATGKTADEILALLRQRLQNDPAVELRIAAEEQRRITRLRLKKLLRGEASK